MATLYRVHLREIIKRAPVIIGSAILVFVWQSIKGEYREFLSQGERSQAIRVSQTEALTKFSELATDALQKDTLLNDEVVGATYRRVGYTEYFAAAVAIRANAASAGSSKLSIARATRRPKASAASASTAISARTFCINGCWISRF